jgi:hypothetical protein
VVLSGVLEEDELVTRYPSKLYGSDKGLRRAVLGRKKYLTCLFWIEMAVGLNGEFSTKCAWIEYVVNGSCDVLSDIEMAGEGGWSLQSKVLMQHYRKKHHVVKAEVIAARDARKKQGESSVPLGAWARCEDNGASSLTLSNVRVMAQNTRLLSQSLAESAKCFP